jgi:hypothetical protein
LQGTSLLYDICAGLLPIYKQHVIKERQYIDILKKQLNNDIPAILPKINVDEAEETPNSTTARKLLFIQLIPGAISLIMGGVNSYLKYADRQDMKKAYRMLKKGFKINTAQIKVLESKLMVLSKTTLKQLNSLKGAIEASNARIDYYVEEIAKELTVQRKQLAELTDITTENRNGIRLMNGLMAQLISDMSSGLNQYQEMVSYVDHFMDALDTLTTGLISHVVIPPSDLEEILKIVASDLRNHYRDYELVLTTVQQYYDLPIVTFGYKDGFVVIDIPLFIRPIHQNVLNLYNIRTVPVPFHIRDQQDPTGPYTWLKPTHPLLGMSDNNFISIDEPQLKTCYKFGMTYFCESVILMQHNSLHTCESAIFWDQLDDIIREKCTFEYLYDYTPEPAVLDAGAEILLAGLPLPWHFICKNKQEIPRPMIGHNYAVIYRHDLCLCSISAGAYYLQENIISCREKDEMSAAESFQLKYTINSAVQLYFPEQFTGIIHIVNTTLMLEPYQDTIPDPVIIRKTIDNVIEQEPVSTSLKTIADMIKTGEAKYEQEADRLTELLDVETWFEEDTYSFGYLLIGSTLAFVCLILILLLCCKLFSLRTRLSGMNFSLSKLLAVPTMLKQIEAQDSGDSDCVRIEEANVIVSFPLLLLQLVMMNLLMIGILFGTFRLCQWLYRFVYVEWILHPSYKSRFWHNPLSNVTDVMMELSESDRYNCSARLYVGSLKCYPLDIKLEHTKNKRGEFDYIQRAWHDTLNISWINIKLKENSSDAAFWPSSCIMIPVDQKFTVRKILKSKFGRYRLYAKYQNEIYPILDDVPISTRKQRPQIVIEEPSDSYYEETTYLQ